MSQDILGYTKNGDPICEVPAGRITTACCISCSVCGEGIRGMGGPMYGAKCPGCFQFHAVVDRANIMVLTGDVLPIGVQCVYTYHNEEEETFEVCAKADANHVSVYLRLPIGEVVPLMDFVIEEGVDHLKWAGLLAKNLKHFYGLDLEPGGALDESTS